MKLPIANCRLRMAPPARTQRRFPFVISTLGFTLVEIMVAVAIFSMVIAAIYATWALVMRATQVGQDTAEQAQRQRVVLRAIGDALMGLESFQASQQYYWFKLANGNQPMLSFVAHLPETYPRNGKFIGEASVRDADGNVHGVDASSRRVTFSLAAGPNGGSDLVLQQSTMLMDMDKDEQQFPLVLAHNVKQFTVEWWGTNDMNEVGWYKDWDDQQTNSIPKMLRVHLVMGANTAKGQDAPDFSATRIYTVPSEMMPVFVERGVGGQMPPGGPGRAGLPTQMMGGRAQ
ncbi:MAG: type II secretion system protein [Verrucomicrobiota bacterium]|jgi:prepilin-type N-terminal cleavage/methylation domain-containing protein